MDQYLIVVLRLLLHQLLGDALRLGFLRDLTPREHLASPGSLRKRIVLGTFEDKGLWMVLAGDGVPECLFSGPRLVGSATVEVAAIRRLR